MIRYSALAVLLLFLLLSTFWQPYDPDAVDILPVIRA